MKQKRQKLISELVSTYDITTQGELQSLLLERGYKVTQATISRDIRELNLVKSLSKKTGEYIYSIPDISKSVPSDKRDYIILKGLISTIDYASNVVVIKCHNGMAQAVCASIDSMYLDDVVGTIAGDDTIFILMRSEHKACMFTSMFSQKFILK